MSSSTNFDKPLNTWVDEKITVKVNEPVFDPNTGRAKIEQVEKEFTQKSYYTDPKSRIAICSNHVYKPHDLKRYIFKCKKCDWHFQGNHPSHKFDPDTGYITHRKTGERL